MPRVLTKLRIDEISSVDKGAGDGWQPKREPQVSDRLDEMAAALIVVNPALTKQEAIRHLLHTPTGRALATHLASIMTKEQPPMGSRMDQLKSFAKSNNGGGAIAMAKHIVAKGETALSEQEFSELVMEAARLQKRDGESDAQAFSRLFQADPEIRAAYSVIKSLMSLEPISVDGSGSVNDTERSEAYAQLTRMADEMRRAAPWMSTAQAFARTFEANAELAAKAHQRPAPTTSYAFP